MPTPFVELQEQLQKTPKAWLVTGVSGFIGSNLLLKLLSLGQRVVGLDNFSTGKKRNLEEVQSLVGSEAWGRFRFLEGDIRNPDTCREACVEMDYVLHQAALGSVPRSIENPLASHESNVNGTLNILVAARDAKVMRLVFASSSSVYGDDPHLPKTEAVLGRQLSPYALTKYVNELYAGIFAKVYEMETVGLRYFNVFGPRQSPDGPYAAVIPKWVEAMIKAETIYVNGTGETSRDFCYIANVVQANLLAATTDRVGAANQSYNIALNDRTSLNTLFELLRMRLVQDYPHLKDYKPVYRDFRNGDVMHSQADVSLATRLLGYEPTYTIEKGLDEALAWYKAQIK